MDGPDFLTATALPYVIDSFVYRGQVPLQDILDTDDYVSGMYFQQRRQTGSHERTSFRRASQSSTSPADPAARQSSRDEFVGLNPSLAGVDM
jgi:hypothetical protein